jgi:hypothetical protein
MALARIITRSETCSKELALDLVARGYAVEIVSPDAIPHNLADLELRVDSTRVDRLTATVEVHNGGRSASLEFLHHLKVPLADFERRRPAAFAGQGCAEPTGAVPDSEHPLSFSSEPGIEDVSEPGRTQPREANTVSTAVARLLDPVVARPQLGPFESGSKESAVRRVLSGSLPLLAQEPPGYFAVEEPTIALPAVAQPQQRPQRRAGSAGWFWRAAVTFAGVVLVALAVGFGTRRAGKLSDRSFGPAPAAHIAAASADFGLVSTSGPEKDTEKGSALVPAPAVTRPAMKLEGTSRKLARQSRRAKAAAAGVQSSNSHGNGLIARDTVVYLDERYKPAAKAKSADHTARRHTNSRKRGGIIAASTVTYLNKPTATAK